MTDDAQNVDRDPYLGSRSSASQEPRPDAEESVSDEGDSAERGRAGDRRPAGERKGARRQLSIPQEVAVLLGMALVLAVVIKAFFLQAFYIPSGSMNDTLVLDDRIVVQKVTYWQGEPQRGDVVVFSDPGGWLGPGDLRTADNPVAKSLEMVGLFPTGGHLVKRVIGVGGDRVVCCDDDGRITVNGVPLHEESYLAPGERPSLIKFDVEVQEGYLWVQGDNRSNSADSRVHLGDPGGGFIPVDDVVGKVFMVVWPWDHATVMKRPATFAKVDAAP